jgi:hypothetical protein
MEYSDLTLTLLEGGNKIDTIKEHKIAGKPTWMIVGGLVIVFIVYKMYFDKFSNTKNEDEDEDEDGDKKNVLQKAKDAVTDAAKAAFGRFI